MTTVAIRRLAKILNGGTPTPDEANWNGDVPWATPVDLAKVNGRNIERTDRTLTDAGLVSGSTLAPQQSVLVSCRAPIGYTAVARVPMAFNQGCKAVVPVDGQCARFLQYCLVALAERMKASGSGSTFLELSSEALASAEIPDVTPGEQRRIADFLDDRVARIDQIITARRQQLTVVESLAWSAFSTVVTRPGTPRLPLRRAIASLADGPFGSAFSSNDYVDLGPAVIRLGNIGFAEFREDDIARIPQELYDYFPHAHVRPGDLLIASLGDARNHAGRACVAPADLGPTMVKGKCFVARANHAIATETYLATLLSSPAGAENLVAQGTGATRNMLNFERLLSTVLPIPDLTRQAAIMRDFNHANETAAAGRGLLVVLLDLLHQYKQSLITAAVTGELDVTTAGSGIPG